MKPMITHSKTFTIILMASGLLVAIAGLSGCDKFLEAKPRTGLEVPLTLKDCQALLDNTIDINENDPYSGEASSDNYFLMDAHYQALTTEELRRMYTWAGSNLYSAIGNDWQGAYDQVMKANTVLEVLAEIPETEANRAEYRDVKGQALFLRAKMFHQVAMVWAQAYDPSTATQALGIPLRQTTDFNEVSKRATLGETYDFIVNELKRAVALLPAYSIHPVRSGKMAAYGMLARVYLSMRSYDNAELYADSCLSLNPSMLDYNTVKAPASGYSFTRFNADVIYDNRLGGSMFINARVDSMLYRSYATDDLRKVLFFQSSTNGTYTFRGSYYAGLQFFTGLTTAEVYLIKAECRARKGDITNAMKWLDDLMENRFKTGKYVSPNITTAKQALDLVLTERRKELVFRGLRWNDIKRLNLEGANISLTRHVLGKTYTLPAGDPRFAIPIPEDVIAISGMPQNP
jgi:hypothetical protein